MADLTATQSRASDEWRTPLPLFDLLDREFKFTLDAAATFANALVSEYYTAENSGLENEWYGRVFCNPPYSQVRKWAKKAYEVAWSSKATVVFLVAARTDTQFWWDHMRYAEVRFLKGRLRFGGNSNNNGAPFPSAIGVFHRDMRYRSPSTIYWDIGDLLR